MKYNLQTITRRFVPHFWQNEENLAFFDLVIDTLNVVNQNLLNKENRTRQRVGYSIQRLSLELSLNNEFDSTLNRIQVVNGELGGSEFIFNENESVSEENIIWTFNEAESTPVGVDTPYIFNENETGQTAIVNFTVILPESLQSRQNEIRAWIDFVLIHGTQYNLSFTL